MENNQVTKVDDEASAAIQKQWDAMSKWYEQRVELSTIQGTVTCAVMTEMHGADRILEIACGPGKHSRMLASSFLKKGGVLVSSDYSSSMVQLLANNFTSEDCDYSLVPGNKHLIDTSADYTEFADDSCTTLKNQCDIDNIINQQGEFRKFVYGCMVNAELVPFPDSYFGAYIANLSVHLVDNPQNQITEAYRVLKNGSAACFTVWGQKEESIMLTMADLVLAKHVNEEQKQEILSAKSAFDFYINRDQSKKWMEEAGFKGIKIWEQPFNLMIRTGQDYVNQMGSSQLTMKAKKYGFSDEKIQEMRAEVIELYDQLSGANTSDLKTFQGAIFVAYKD